MLRIKTPSRKKINEVAANETALHMNKLDGWFEANKFLTPEQQKEWREVLRAEAMKHMEQADTLRTHERFEGMDHRERS